MANSKLIIVEGPQGAGKTTVTDYIRYSLSYTNLYRMCGTADSTKTGLTKAANMYNGLLEYISSLQNTSVNLVFDRTFFTEECYCRLGKKEYDFNEVYNDLVERLNNFDFEIYYINLYLKDTSLFEKRLNNESRANKAVFKNSSFNAQNSIEQQRVYSDIATEIKKNIKTSKYIISK